MSLARIIFVWIITLGGAVIGATDGLGEAMLFAGMFGMCAMWVSRDDAETEETE